MEKQINICDLGGDIEERLKSDFPGSYQRVINLMNEFCLTRDYLYHSRIIRCIIHLANKDEKKIQDYLKIAAGDPRDVMLYAEYIRIDATPERVRDFQKPFGECELT